MDSRVLGVLGASGGLGSSTLAVALSVRAAPVGGACLLVDGRLGAGGVDVTACAEHVEGLRWGDLADLDGAADGAAVLSRLPRVGGTATRVLAARGSPPSPTVVVEVLEALAPLVPLTVVDLGSSGGADELLERCTDVLVVAGTSARQLADAAALGDHEPLWARSPRLVLRGSRREPVDPDAVAAHLDLPLVGVLRDDPRVRADAERAATPGRRARGALEAVCDRLLRELSLEDAPVWEVGA